MTANGDEFSWSATFDAMEMAAVGLAPEGCVIRANPSLLALTGRTLEETLGRNWFRDFVSHRDRARAQSALDTVVASGEAARLRSSLCGQAGEIHLLEWAATPMAGPSGRVEGVLLLGRATGQSEATLAALRTTNEIIRAILSDEDPTDVLRAAAAGARDLFDADLALIVVPAGETELTVRVAVGPGADNIEGSRYSRAGSITERVIDSGRPLAIVGFDGPAAHRRGHWFAPFGPSLVLPLSAGDRVLGALVLARRRGEPRFTEHDQRVVGTLAEQLALALEFARAEEGLREEAVLRDQERIARDLHDRVVHRIHAANWGLQAAFSLGGAPEQSRRIERAMVELDRAVGEIRASIFALQEAVAGGLRDQVVHAVTHAADRLGFAPSLTLQGDLDAVTPPIGAHLLSALQEALSNVARHAAATSTEVTVAADPVAGLTLTVLDNGVGIGPALPGGMGLRNLASRADLQRGRVSIGPAPVGGTLLTWAVPLDAEPSTSRRGA